LFAGGISAPVVSAAAGVVWILGKYFYAQGYSTGDPSKRTRGFFGYFGLITLLYTSGLSAYQLLN
jgi:glutathione S-transferase